MRDDMKTAGQQLPPLPPELVRGSPGRRSAAEAVTGVVRVFLITASVACGPLPGGSAPLVVSADAGSTSAVVRDGSITLQGAVTQTFAVPMAGVTQNTLSGSTRFILGVTGERYQISVVVKLPNAPQVGSVSERSPGLSCDFLVEDRNISGAGWFASHDDGVNPDSGTCSLSFTAVTIGFRSDLDHLQSYIVNGSLRGTLPASGLASGSITLDGTF